MQNTNPSPIRGLSAPHRHGDFPPYGSDCFLIMLLLSLERVLKLNTINLFPNSRRRLLKLGAFMIYSFTFPLLSIPFPGRIIHDQDITPTSSNKRKYRGHLIGVKSNLNFFPFYLAQEDSEGRSDPPQT